MQEELRLKIYGDSFDTDTIIDEENDITASQQEQILCYTQQWLKNLKDNCLPGIRFFMLSLYIFYTLFISFLSAFYIIFIRFLYIFYIIFISFLCIK